MDLNNTTIAIFTFAGAKLGHLLDDDLRLDGVLLETLQPRLPPLRPLLRVGERLLRLGLRLLGAVADLGDGSGLRRLGLRLRLLLCSILLRVGRGSVVLIKGLDVLEIKCNIT